jgi:hypothetical protein
VPRRFGCDVREDGVDVDVVEAQVGDLLEPGAAIERWSVGRRAAGGGGQVDLLALDTAV